MLQNLIALDTFTYLWLVKFQQQKGIVKFFRIASFTGDGYLYPLIAVVILYLDTIDGLTAVFTALLAFLFEIPLFIFLKKLFKRDRPFEKINLTYKKIQPSDKFSLPSGHSTAAFLVATLLAFYYPILAPFTFTWASLVAVSRVILGVHYPLDILSGAILGTGCTFTSILLLSII